MVALLKKKALCSYQNQKQLKVVLFFISFRISYTSKKGLEYRIIMIIRIRIRIRIRTMKLELSKVVSVAY